MCSGKAVENREYLPHRPKCFHKRRRRREQREFDPIILELKAESIYEPSGCTISYQETCLLPLNVLQVTVRHSSEARSQHVVEGVRSVTALAKCACEDMVYQMQDRSSVSMSQDSIESSLSTAQARSEQ